MLPALRDIGREALEDALPAAPLALRADGEGDAPPHDAEDAAARELDIAVWDEHKSSANHALVPFWPADVRAEWTDATFRSQLVLGEALSTLAVNLSGAIGSILPVSPSVTKVASNIRACPKILTLGTGRSVARQLQVSVQHVMRTTMTTAWSYLLVLH